VRIKQIDCHPVWIGHRNQLLVKITTDDGLHGWGESGLSGRELAVIGAIDHFRGSLIGRDPMQSGALWQELYRGQYFEGGRVLTAAISAIDIALHDIRGKALNLPVHQLLGGKQRDKIPALASTFAPPGPEMIAEALEFVGEGFRAIRLQRGGRDENPHEPWDAIGETAPWMTKAREAVGAAIVLGVDFHHRLSLAEAASFCQRMPRGTLDFLEEPIRDETPEAYETLRKMTDIPFAIGEEFSSKWQALPYIERGLSQYMRIDLCNIGGYTEAMKVAAMCEAHYVDLMPHNPLGPVCTAASLHFAAAIPNFAWLEYNRSKFRPAPQIEIDLLPNSPTLEGAFFTVPETPGIGIEVNEKLLGREEFQYWNPPTLRRRDGSFTNW
jgi:galactonate dehydratase